MDSRRSLEPLAGRTDVAVPTKFEGIGFNLYDVASLDFDKEAAVFGAPLPVDVKGLSPRRAVRHDQSAQRRGMEQARHGISPGPNKGVKRSLIETLTSDPVEL